MNHNRLSLLATLVVAAFQVCIAPCVFAQQEAPLTERERQMLDRIEKLEQRLAAIEAKGSIAAASSPIPAQDVLPASAPAPPPDSPSLPGFLAGTTINGYLDGYYGFNFNHPAGRINLLHANDVTSNNFTINQADIVIERAPDASAGRRLGFRLDLMFGQNTESMQGNAVNEPRPQVYRNLYQVFGSYVVPVGSGLQVDFGKFASPLGYETNWAKDQFNYSRSYYFNALPFYHMGFRNVYKVNSKLALQYWLVNGINQTEDFNGFKTNVVEFTVTPSGNFAWNFTYCVGQEGRDVVPIYNPGLPTLPTQPGLSTERIFPRQDGREHMLDTYVTWNATKKLAFTAEADYVINRSYSNGAPAHFAGGAGYARYQFTPKFNLAGRFEYLSDRGGLFSGTTQALKEGTLTATLQPVDGFQIRTEYRRDYSNQPFFLTSIPGRLKQEQNIATLGLIWWFGGKQGAW